METISEEGEQERRLLSRDPEDDDREVPATSERPKSRPRSLFIRLGVSFFLFGLINNVLYVIILSAALDLVPPETPKGIIAFCNIFPALVAKVGWPYILKGRIRYAKRLIGCTALSVCGMLVVALFDSLVMRLLGICLASFSSGLGELSFLQLSTVYHPPAVGGVSVGYFAAGTGAAGLVGASLWWVVRGLGVRVGVGLSSILPLVIPVAYFLYMPRPTDFSPDAAIDELLNNNNHSPTSYSAVPTEEDPNPRTDDIEDKTTFALTAADKWQLVKPMLMTYMLPLFFVYVFEYTINQGIAPTLIYPVPSPDDYWLISHIIHSIRDYYPFWQLVYQTTVFLSRSSISLGLPPIPANMLPVPAVAQALILTTLAFESAVGIFGSQGFSFAMVLLLIGLEGICGGLAYVNVFYRINQEHTAPASDDDPHRTKQEREFRIGSVGFADSTGILLAAILAVPTEVGLCKAQIARGKVLCKGL